MRDYKIEPDDACEICGKPASETELEWVAHGGTLACAGKCDPRYDHPRRRKYAAITEEILDDLEYQADASDAFINGVPVDPDILHSMVREVRGTLRPKKALPTPCDLRIASDWILSGCPAYPIMRYGERSDPKVAIDILHRLTEALPSHFPQYCYGTSEHKEAMIACQDALKVKCWHKEEEP
jgi:hypothetical protein